MPRSPEQHAHKAHIAASPSTSATLNSAGAWLSGQRAVLVGVAWLWGLAAGGERGVREVLGILQSGIDEALIGLGHDSIHELSRADLIVPASS